jgi:hypothetical protein
MGALMDRSTDNSTGTCARCGGKGYLTEHIPNTYGIKIIPCSCRTPQFTFKIPGITGCVDFERIRNERNRRDPSEGGV